MAVLNKIPQSVRLAFDFKSWHPSENEWCSAIMQLQQEERERIKKFRYRDDAKASLIGRLMIRKWCKEFSGEFGLQSTAVNIVRTDKGRPSLLLKSDKKDLIKDWNFDFNVAHAGDFTVFAAEICRSSVNVGVDVMPLFSKRKEENKEEFLRLMKRQFTTKEWDQIRKLPSEYDEGLSETMKCFYRFWCLKESFVKAEGTGLAWNLQRLSFNCTSPELKINEILTDTTLEIDGAIQSEWQFQEHMLNINHCVSVALNTKNFSKVTTTPFHIMNINELLDSRALRSSLPEEIDTKDWKNEWDCFKSKDIEKPF